MDGGSVRVGAVSLSADATVAARSDGGGGMLVGGVRFSLNVKNFQITPALDA